MIIWAAFKGMVVVVKKSHQQLRIKISFYTMFHLNAYSCWRIVLLCWILKRMKKQPRADFNNHIVFKENLHCRTTTSTCGRRWRDFTGSLKPSKDSLLKRKSDCQQNLSSISSQKNVWQILLVPNSMNPAFKKKGQQNETNCLTNLACSRNFMSRAFK